ncbi:MAG TPA: hypothetical protein VF503_05795 [Sphingobium sp.]|uniref:hypothetical protein n=1 Tax=Sphingobium sp. TaxID=1912891 RepID=UPI002ED36FD9
MEEARPKKRKLDRRFAALFLWLVVTVFLSRDGWSPHEILAAILSAGLMAALFLLLHLIETRSQRPRRSYYRWALVSALLFGLLVIGVAAWGGAIVLGCITWVVMSGLGLFWTIHYERTEPLT